MALDIPTGQLSHSPTDTLPLDGSQSPGVAGVTPTTPVASGPADSAPLVGGVRDLTGERLSQLGGDEQAIAAAMHQGMTARENMLHHYEQDILPQGCSYGDDLPLPDVPTNAVPPAMSDLYPYSGMEPTPASAGFFHGGNEPLPE